MAKKRPVPAVEVESPMREKEVKKRKTLFKQGDVVMGVEDDSLIVIVTRDVEKGQVSFHGTCILSNKRQVGEHERFWLIERFEKIPPGYSLKLSM